MCYESQKRSYGKAWLLSYLLGTEDWVLVARYCYSTSCFAVYPSRATTTGFSVLPF